MSGPERWLLLALSLLVARQRAISRGEPEPAFWRTLREPLLFRFAGERGAFRCPLGASSPELFFSSVLVAERADFVSPLSALAPHVRLVQGSSTEAKLSGELVARLGLSGGDNVYAVYSPLQVLFTAQTGFFLPHRESWHAYLRRCVAARAPGASFQARESADAAHLAFESPGLRFELQVGRRGFGLSARGSSRLMDDLRKFCASGAMPEGVRASLEDGGALRIGSA